MKIGDKVRCVKYDTGLTVGEEYTLTGFVNGFDRKCIRVDDKHTPYYADYFEIINPPSLEEKIKLAKYYIDKTIIAGKTNNEYKVTKVDIVISRDDAYRLKVCSDVVFQQLETDDVVVVVSDDDFSYPVEMVKLAPICKKVKLNDKYDAVVYQDKIIVGCQTFPIGILDELNDAYADIC